MVDAVECAVALQRGMAERNDGVREDSRIELRIGINLGDVIVEGEDRHGEGVNIAARLQELAEPGGICVAATSTIRSRTRSAWRSNRLGEYRVKNIAEPVSVYRVLLDGTRARSQVLAWVARVRGATTGHRGARAGPADRRRQCRRVVLRSLGRRRQADCRRSPSCPSRT